MVAPKKVVNNGKEKAGDQKSKSPSPEPFQEPDGMTTIDLNKSDDYSKAVERTDFKKWQIAEITYDVTNITVLCYATYILSAFILESELEKAELKTKAQIKYLAKLLFALGSIFVMVLLLFMLAYINKEYHLFTVVPLKINQSHFPITIIQSPTPTDDILNLTRILNQEKFRKHLQSGNYIQKFPFEMDLCKQFRSIDFCCKIFRDSDLEEFSEFCTVEDMLNYLMEKEINSRENQIVYEAYPQKDWPLIINEIDLGINEESDKVKNKKTRMRNKRYINYNPYEPQHLRENEQRDIDPYNDFNQYQSPEHYHPPDQYYQQYDLSGQYRAPNQYNPYYEQYQEPYQYHPPDQYQPPEQYQEPNQYHLPNQYHSPEQYQPEGPEYQNEYLQAPHIPISLQTEHNIFNAENVQQNIGVPQILNKNDHLPENIIPEIKDFLKDFPVQNLKNNDQQHFFVPENIEQFESFGMGQEINTQSPQLNKKIKVPDNNSESNFKQNTHIDNHDVADVAPKLQSVLLPLPDRVRENILHHVTVAPKDEHVYKSSDFHQRDFDENTQGNYEFEESEIDDSGRLSKDDGRSNIDYRLKVDANGKFHIDNNQDKFKNRQEGKNVKQNRLDVDPTLKITSDKFDTFTNHTEPLRAKEAQNIVSSNLSVQNKDQILKPVVASVFNPIISNVNIEESKKWDSQISKELNGTEDVSSEAVNNKFDQNTILPISNEQIDYDQLEFQDTTESKIELTDKVEEQTIIVPKKNAEKGINGQKILENSFLRSNAAQDIFRGKQKQDSFTASEDTQSNQQTYINPCFNPYMSPYIPFMPPTMPSMKVGSTQEPGYLKVVSVSQPSVQNQPMYVLNPPMLYGIPPTQQSAFPSFPQNSFLPQGYFPQVAQSPYGSSYNSPVQVTSPGGQYYMCNPIPNPTNNIAGLAGVEVRRDASNLQSLMEDVEDFSRNNKSREATTIICPIGEQACLDNIKCIKNHHVCDSEVHCDDSSDEIGCTCKDRVGKLRLCDGYCDCPTCEDEQGCFGCEEDEYSCDDWSRFRRSTCVPVSQRCDGIKQCEMTGKDELDCSILADHIGNFALNKISNAVGFLHRNYRGKWYPTCFGTELWAAQVCQVEAGPSAIIPKAHMTLTTDPYNGLFINILPNNEVSLVNTCVQDRAAFVECPPIYCGLRFLVNNPYRNHEVDTSIEDMLNDLERAYKLREDSMMRSSVDSGMDIDSVEEEEYLSAFNHSDLNDRFRDTRSGDVTSKDDLKHAHLTEVINHLERTFRRREVSNGNTVSDLVQQSRVVGGKPSQPAAWPWLVSIYKNGIFHCGGVLINELWIATASHCVDRYWQYYYEVQAGALRRLSYSPMDQHRWVKVVVPHEFYSKSNLRNDIALMKMSAPVRYNKYVRPICLPSDATAGPDFLTGPSPGTICTTVGWGATVEHGADPDHMREVEVPILQHCKHKEDSDVEEICAGLTDGGKDACQGDSGGPLMCRNPSNPNQWYLAGIVSHGEGCARPNEPGVYTKVSRYMGWIAENTREDKFTITSPLQKCPGFVCQGTKRCIPKKRRCDRIIDCLLGDDELNCEDHFRQIFKHSRKSMLLTNRDIQSTNTLMNGGSIQNFEEIGIVGSKLNATNDKQPSSSIVNNGTNEKSDKMDNDLEAEILDRVKQKKVQELYFRCQTMLQVIPINKRCNKAVDCEDGTDELNCTCADYIKNVDPSAICDGVSDCADLSDEKHCITCNQTEYTCRLAQKCIDNSKRCDGTADCPQHEDEMDCASLTNGHTLTLDRDFRPMFKSRGIVTINHLGQWKPLCLNTSSPFTNEQPSIATAICNVLGFDDYFSYHKYLVENSTVNVTYSLRNGRIFPELKEKTCHNCCEGLYISCLNTSTSSTLQYKSLDQVNELYFSPWTAAIYSNGYYRCTGTLLNQYWVVTSVKCFTGITILQGQYVVAVFGKGKIHLPVKGPHEQIIRVVGSITVNETDIVLLRLEQDVKYNRYVQAAHLNVRKDGHQKERCYAIGQDNEKRVKVVSLYPLEQCLVGFRCFEKKIEENCKDIHSWSGTIVCDSRSGWYPAAVFNEESGHCGFHNEKKYTSVKFYKNLISRIMRQTVYPTPPPHRCDGVQCKLGNCISKEKVCDGIVDCHSGEDEKSSLCYQKEKECYTTDDCVCPQTHLKCPKSHKCFPKASFCDRINNCGEFEDEPEICSCRNYLELTDPGKNCDGIVHCMDRSDEDPNICTCGREYFQCGKSNKCVPQDMVCDDVEDCPNGEDEATCLSLNTKSHDRTNAGEVMTRTAGLWHRGCFDLNYSTLQLEEICYRLGFSGSSANQLTPPTNITLATPRPILDRFDVVWLRRQPGNKLKLGIRTGHDPYVQFVPDERCHRLFIACL